MSRLHPILLLALAALIALSGFGSPLTASATPLNQEDADLSVYEVTLENLTIGQPFSPPVAATHSDLVRMFIVGAPASDALAAIAQDGDPAPMVELLGDTDNGVTDVVSVGRPLAPDGTVVELGGRCHNQTITLLNGDIAQELGGYINFSAHLVGENDDGECFRFSR